MHGFGHYALNGLGPALSLSWGPDFPGPRPTARPVVYQRHGWPTLLRPSIAQTLRPETFIRKIVRN
jgi:hypothetical protein